MTEIDTDLVRRLAAVLDETGLSEIEYESGGTRVRVARTMQHTVLASAGVPMMAPAAGVIPAVATPADRSAHPGAIKAPMVGIVYLSPEPGAAAFANVGDTVAEGQTLVLIEAMKTFNPVKATRAGKVVQILVESGAPVEYGEVLVIIE